MTVIKLTGPLSYQVQTDAGIVLRHHVDHLRFRYPNDNTHSLDNHGLDSDLVIYDDDDWPLPTGLEEPGESGISEEPDVEEDRQEHPGMSPTPPPIVVQPQRRPQSCRPTPSRIPVRHSTRTRPPIDRYSPLSQT